MLQLACKVKVLCQAVGEVGCASKQFFGTAYWFFQRDHGLKGFYWFGPWSFYLYVLCRIIMSVFLSLMMYSCQVFNNPGAILELLIGPQRRVVLSGFEEPVMEWSCQGKVIKSWVIDLIQWRKRKRCEGKTESTNWISFCTILRLRENFVNPLELPEFQRWSLITCSLFFIS